MIKKIKFHFLEIILFYVLTATIQTFAQQTSLDWVAVYNGAGNNADDLWDICVDDSGNVYIAGQSKGQGSDYDFMVIKYNHAGILKWADRYNGTANSRDCASVIKVDKDGFVYATGYSSETNNNYDFVTIKYNLNGIQQWTAKYNGISSGQDVSKDLCTDNLGNVYVTGASDTDYVTIKYNSLGNLQWISRYNGGYVADIPVAMVMDNTGNLYVTGYSYLSGSSADYLTIKYNPSGIQQWIKRYNGGTGSNSDYPSAITSDNQNNIYVTGESNVPGTGNDYATVKYNSQGVQQWVQRYSAAGSNEDKANSIAVDTNRNVYVTGISQSHYCTIKYDTSGVQNWVVIYDGPGVADQANSICVDISGNIYVTGTSDRVGYAFTTIKYNTLGVQQWIVNYQQGVTYEGGRVIKLDKQNNVIVGGYTGAADYSDFVVLKYSQVIGITPISNEIPKKYNLSQNYPNPFNPTTNIKFGIPKMSNVKISVFDILGKEVSVLVNEELNQGTFEVNWDASNFPSGVYFYKLVTDKYVETKKMIQIK